MACRRARPGPGRCARSIGRRRPPWEPIDPLDELINTILSQNTNDLNRDRAYHALRAKFPTWAAVRDAPDGAGDRGDQTGGTGESKRAAHSKSAGAHHGRARRTGHSIFSRDLPVAEAKAWLTSLDGVGPKTASIVLLFALGKPAFPVDTHIHRVTGRLGLIPPKTSADQGARDSGSARAAGVVSSVSSASSFSTGGKCARRSARCAKSARCKNTATIFNIVRNLSHPCRRVSRNLTGFPPARE